MGIASLKRIIKTRNLTQADLAILLDMKQSEVSRFLNKPKDKLTVEFFDKLNLVLNFTIEEKEILGSFYEELKNKQAEQARLTKDLAQLYQIYNISEFLNLPSIKQRFGKVKTSDKKTLIDTLKLAFDVPTFDALFNAMEKELPVAYRSNSKMLNNLVQRDENILNLRVFNHELRQQGLSATDRQNNLYDREALINLCQLANQYSSKDNGLVLFIQELEKIGVSVIHVKHLQKTYLDGASTFINNKPVVALTLRLGYDDNIWYALLHECYHIIYDEEELKNTVLLNDLKKKDQENEKKADEFPSTVLRLNEIKEMVKAFITKRPVQYEDIDQLSQKYQVNKSLVVGSLQYNKFISYSHYNEYKQNVKETVKKYLER